MTEQAKPTRAEEVRTERRRKPGQVSLAGIKLAVDESKLDRKNYEYRFANDAGGRLQRLHAQDWDIAPEGAKEDTNSLGSVNSAHAGVIEGKPFNTILMRKPRKMFEEDQNEKQRPLDEMEEAIRRGSTEHKANELRGAGVYTPGTNKIERA